MKNVLMLSAVVLLVAIVAAPASAGLTFASGTLTYGAPGDFTNVIDPNNIIAAGLPASYTGTGTTGYGPADNNTGLGYPLASYAGHSFGAVGTGASTVDVVTPAVFAALPNVYVMPLSNLPGQTSAAPGPAINEIVADFNGTDAVTFTNAGGAFANGGYTNRAKISFEDPTTVWNDVAVDMGAMNLNIAATNPNDQVTAVAYLLCAAQSSGYFNKPGTMTVTTSDLITHTVAWNQFGGSTAWTSAGGGGTAFFSYQAAPGLSITNVTMSRNASGNGNDDMGDLAFQVTATATPEPATMSLLILGGIGMIGGAIRRRKVA